MNQFCQGKAAAIPRKFSYGNQTKPLNKDDQWVKNHFIQSISPIYYFSRSVGLMPFTIVHDKNEKVLAARVTVFDFAWFVISVCMHLGFLIFWCQNMDVSENESGSHVLPIGEATALIIWLIYSVFCVAVDMYNRHRLVDIMRKFIVFDKDVSKMELKTLSIYQIHKGK